LVPARPALRHRRSGLECRAVSTLSAVDDCRGGAQDRDDVAVCRRYAANIRIQQALDLRASSLRSSFIVAICRCLRSSLLAEPSGDADFCRPYGYAASDRAGCDDFCSRSNYFSISKALGFSFGEDCVIGDVSDVEKLTGD